MPLQQYLIAVDRSFDETGVSHLWYMTSVCVPSMCAQRGHVVLPDEAQGYIEIVLTDDALQAGTAAIYATGNSVQCGPHADFNSGAVDAMIRREEGCPTGGDVGYWIKEEG